MNQSQNNKITHLPTTANISNLSLNQLADAANREAVAGDEAFVRGLQHYKACGEYLIAAKAKGKAEHGSSWRWSKWLDENWKKSDTSAKRFMQLASNWEKISSMHGLFSEDMGINSALKLLSVQPDTVDVEVIETEVIKQVETIKTVVEPDPTTTKKLSETEKQLDTQRKENEALRKQLEAANKEKDSLLKQPPASTPVAATVIPSDYEELKRKAEELNSMPSQFAELQRQLAQVKKEKDSLLSRLSEPVLPSDYEEIKAKAKKHDEYIEQYKKSISDPKNISKETARKIYDDLKFVLSGKALISEKDLTVFSEIENLIKTLL